MRSRYAQPYQPFSWSCRQWVLVVIAAVVLVNALAWLLGEKILVMDARKMDVAMAERQAHQITHLLEKEAEGLRQIIRGRAERLAEDEKFWQSEPARGDFLRNVAESFLAGANINAFLIKSAAHTPIFSADYRPATGITTELSAPERQHLVSLLETADPAAGGFARLDVSPKGAVIIVAAVPIGRNYPRGWVIASRELGLEQVENYSNIIEKAFTISPAVPADAEKGSGLSAIEFDQSGQAVRWRLAGPADGRPLLQLSMGYDREYETHMARSVALGRGVILLFSVFSGVLVAMLAWHWQLNRQREESSRREVERIARLATVGELAAGIAHEVNNPNAMIRHNLDFVQDVLDDALPLLAERADSERLSLGGVDFAMAREQLPQLLADMTRGSRRIGEIVSDLKDFARVDAPEDASEFDLNEAVAAAVRLLDGTIRKTTDQFRLNLGTGLPPVSGNLRQIEQVVLNLVQNACQALPDATSAIAVATRYDAGRRRNLVEVADEGAGITPEQRERIFEPFFTTRRENGGTGLGLSVSLRIILRHGGTLEVDTVPGCGTLMTLSLPIVEESV